METITHTEGDQLKHPEHGAPSTEQKTQPKKPVSREDKSKKDLVEKVDHKIPLSELTKKYNTDLTKGLDEAHALKVLHEQGENKLTEKKKTPLWVKLIIELTNGFALMLWVGAALCFLAYGLTPDDPSNLYLAIVILIVITITSGITF